MAGKIVTNTEKTINETIETGQIIRNGKGNGFVMEVSEDTVTLKPFNDPDGKTAVLPRKIFVQLYFRNNYIQVPEGVSPLRDFADASAMGSNRFIVK